MATSTIPAFIDALYARFQADVTINTAQVCDGLPWPKQLEPEAVLIMAARPGDPTGFGAGGQRAAALGAQHREERYVVDVVVSVLKPSRETQQSARARAFQLAAAIETSIKSWGPAFGGIVRVAQITGITLDQPANQDAREARVVVEIACQQRI